MPWNVPGSSGKAMDESDSRADGQTVIVIDDDPAVLAALQFALELEGFAVEVFHEGSELLSGDRLPRAGCLVIDYVLPGMNGLDVLAALRSRRVTLPAILITTHPSTILRERAAAQGMQIVEKPLLGDALINAIRHSLEGQAADAS